MKKINLKIELEYNEETIYGSSNSEQDYIINDILMGNIKLFSDEIGKEEDEIKNIKILSIKKQ